MCGRLLVPVLLEHSALCRLLAAWFRGGRVRAESDVSFPPREHRRTSLTSPSIFLERMVGNTALTRSSTLFLKAESRHTRFNMNTPGAMAGRDRERGEDCMLIKPTTFKNMAERNKMLKTLYLWGLAGCRLSAGSSFLQRQQEDSSYPQYCLYCLRRT